MSGCNLSRKITKILHASQRFTLVYKEANSETCISQTLVFTHPKYISNRSKKVNNDYIRESD